MVVKNGDKVKVEYTGSFEYGLVFDSTDGKAPLEFVVGSGSVIKGFDEALIGMKEGEEKDVKILPENAYGNINPQLVKKVLREQIPNGDKIKKGMILELRLPNGQQMPVRVTNENNKEVTLDMNHILAGNVLNFTIKLLEIL